MIIINRLFKINWNLEIKRRKVSLGRNILLEDVQVNAGAFTPIGVIHHSGKSLEIPQGDTTKQMFLTNQQESGSEHEMMSRHNRFWESLWLNRDTFFSTKELHKVRIIVNCFYFMYFVFQAFGNLKQQWKLVKNNWRTKLCIHWQNCW